MQASTQGRRASGSNVYVVEQGDTLFDIARYELGKASRWAEIYDLNRDVLGEDFDHLSPGTELTLPAKQVADSFTRQDDCAISVSAACGLAIGRNNEIQKGRRFSL